MTSSSHLPRLTWAHLQRYLDETLELAPAQTLSVTSYSGIPLTLADTNTMRRAISKLRRARALRAGDSRSPYDGLTIRSRLRLNDVKISAVFPYGGHVPSRTLLENDKHSIASPCALHIIAPSGAEWTLGSESHPHPSFHSAWLEIRPYLPASLLITNDYAIQEGRDFEIIGEKTSDSSLLNF